MKYSLKDRLISYIILILFLVISISFTSLLPNNEEYVMVSLFFSTILGKVAQDLYLHFFCVKIKSVTNKL